MDNKLQFRDKLAGILKYCEEKDNCVEKEDVEKYFEDDNLSNEQMELVFDYLLSKKIIVKDYVKAGGTISQADNEKENEYSEEEIRYLKNYEEELRGMSKEDPLYSVLPKVVALAKKLYNPQVFLGDLVQEGNMGVLMARMNKENASDDEMLHMATESMQAFLGASTESKVEDQKMVEKVQDLDEKIKEITKEMGRKVSVDELADFLQISEDEIARVLQLAGEDLPKDETEEQ